MAVRLIQQKKGSHSEETDETLSRTLTNRNRTTALLPSKACPTPMNHNTVQPKATAVTISESADRPRLHCTQASADPKLAAAKGMRGQTILA